LPPSGNSREIPWCGVAASAFGVDAKKATSLVGGRSDSWFGDDQSFCGRMHMDSNSVQRSQSLEQVREGGFRGLAHRTIKDSDEAN
jgi:hypothetical protein